MRKVVINTCWGGFGLSEEACKFIGIDEKDSDEIPRDDERLVTCVETLGKRANAYSSELKVVQIPDDVKWYIRDYDGLETIEEEHRTWC